MENIKNQSELSVEELSQMKRLRFRSGDLDESGKPLKSPALPLNHQVVAMVTYDEDDTKLITCRNLAEMQEIHVTHKQLRSGLTLDWFSAPREL